MSKNNDWFQCFLDECCEIDKNHIAKSGQLYDEYRAFSSRTGKFSKSTAAFYKELDSRNFERKRTNKGSFIRGLRIKSKPCS